MTRSRSVWCNCIPTRR